MTSELESSLTDIGWLNHKLMMSSRLSRERGTEEQMETLESSPVPSEDRSTMAEASKHQLDSKVTPVNAPKEWTRPPQKPVLSYASLIVQAIKSTPRNRMTLGEIYAWITSTYPYFRHSGNGWKNSVRHNLSLNKCFAKISRSKDDRGKGSYWTVDESFLNKNGCLRSRPGSRITASSTRSLTGHRRLSPYGINLFPNRSGLGQNLDRRTLDFGSIDSCDFIADEHLFNFQEASHQVENQMCQLYPLVVTGRSVILYDPVSETTTQDKTQSVSSPLDQELYPHTDLDILTSNLFGLAGIEGLEDQALADNVNLNDSFKKLFKTVFEGVEDPVLPSDSIKNYERLKNSIKLASSTNWSEIELSGFPDLAESIKAAECSKWLLDSDQVLDLAASLSSFYSSATCTDGQSLDFDAISPSLETSNHFSPREEQTTASISVGFRAEDDEIEDDFNWDSLLLN